MLDYRPDWYPQAWGDTKILGKADAFVPTERGTYRLGLANVASTFAATLGATVVSGFATTKTDGSHRFFAGCTTSIQEGLGTAWTNRSAATYAATDWWFDQLGDVTIATDLVDNVQSSSSGAFAALSGSPPKAKIVVVQSNIALLFNINDGTSRPDGYATSDVVGLGGTPTTWTVASTNECKRGRFTDTPGAITNAVRFRDGVLVFKRRGMWFGRYVGRPLIWKWELVSDKVGCVSTRQGGAIVAGETCYFVGDGEIFSYDGVAVRSIAEGMIRTFSRRVYPFQDTCRIQNAVEKKLLYFWWDVGSSDKMRCYTYNYASDRWGGEVTAAQFFGSTASVSLVVPINTDFAQAASVKSVTPQITTLALNGASTAFFLDMYDYISAATTMQGTMDLPYLGDIDSGAEINGMTVVGLAGGIIGGTFVAHTGDRSMIDTSYEGFTSAGTASGTFNTGKRRFDIKANGDFILFRLLLTTAQCGSANQVVYYLGEIVDFVPRPPPAGRAGGRK